MYYTRAWGLDKQFPSRCCDPDKVRYLHRKYRTFSIAVSQKAPARLHHCSYGLQLCHYICTSLHLRLHARCSLHTTKPTAAGPDAAAGDGQHHHHTLTTMLHCQQPNAHPRTPYPPSPVAKRCPGISLILRTRTWQLADVMSQKVPRPATY